MMNAASTHEMSEAGPATVAAPNAPSNHPEPMIEPRDTNVSPQKPIERSSVPECSWLPTTSVAIRNSRTDIAGKALYLCPRKHIDDAQSDKALRVACAIFICCAFGTVPVICCVGQQRCSNRYLRANSAAHPQPVTVRFRMIGA